MNVDKSNIPDIKEKLAAFFETREEVISAYLFGSVVSDRATLVSDIDIAVACDFSCVRESQYPYGYQAGLTSHLMHLLGSNRVDLVLLNEASPTLKHRIFTRGTLVFCRNPEFEKQAFVRAFHEYQDTARLRKIQFFYLKRYLKSLGETRVHGGP
ncbi:MAG: nucleotidyltransferase domain-containing protein [Candidatus Omnitrophica bacterium]|nr:nucleotidyltransferase domain-containing protein [Candidatus Omnitrophota bacterium]